MERLTVPTEKLSDGRTRRHIIDAREVRKHAMKIYWRLEAYEDTGLEPSEIPTGLELAKVYAALTRLKQYEAIGTVEEFRTLNEAKEGGCLIILPSPAKGGDPEPECFCSSGGGTLSQHSVL